ncbi:MAG: hypothetical protein K2X44_05115, partial [Magnetospirillum sp.]|nr:hypothetical protein [Magnetospirillum sp.]
MSIYLTFDNISIHAEMASDHPLRESGVLQMLTKAFWFGEFRDLGINIPYCIGFDIDALSSQVKSIRREYHSTE